MKWFKDLKISSKLSLCFAFIAIVAALIGWAGISGVTRIGENAKSMYSDQLIPIRDLGAANTSFQLSRAEARDMLVDKNVAARQKYVDRVSAEDKKIDTCIDEYSKTLLSTDEQQTLPKFRSALEQYRRIRARVFDLLLKGQDAPAWDLMDGEAKQYATEASDSLRSLVDINTKLADEHQKQNVAAQATAKAQVIALLIFGVIAALGLGLFLARFLGEPMRAMQVAAEKLAGGDVNVTIDFESKDEIGALSTAFRDMISMIKDRAALAQRIASGDVHTEVKPRSEHDLLGHSFLQVVETLRKLINETNLLATAATQGKLATRGNAQQFEGAYRQVVEGMNATLDAVIGPLNVASEYFNKIGNGQVPQRITKDYSGDFAVLKDSLNNCITGLNGLQEVNTVLQLIAANDYTKTVEGQYPGLFGEVGAATNQALARLRHAVDVMHLIADGNFREKLDELKRVGKRSENDTFVPAFIRMMEAIVALVDDAKMLVNAAVQGKLSTRADAARHQGDYRKVVEGVNATLDAVIGPLNVAANYVDRLSKGDIPPKLTEAYNGDFNSIKNNLNACIEALNGLIQQMVQMSDAHNAGDIDAHIEENTFEGAYKTMAKGVNGMVAGHIAVKKKAMACVAEFGKGNFEAVLEKFPGKKVFINDTIEQVRSRLKALIADADMLANAAVQGRLDTRADANSHDGDFRKIVAGVNATLDAVISPLKDVEFALAKLADGDFTVQIDKQYAGSFNELKNAVNTMVAQVRSALVKIGKETNTLASASEQLGRVSQQMSASAEETAAQANVVSAASEQVSTNIQTVATGADEMGASIKEIAKNTADATKIANNAVQLSRTTNETVRKLGASSAEIGQVIKVITSIAQQTNLLALNATIEAARAGEAGKGFAVVANEVKELAKQTAQATEDISQKIQAIQQDASGAVTAIGQITEVIGQISDIQNTVATAIEEQSATTNEISRNLAEAAKGGADITLNITSVAQVAKTTTEAAGQTQMSAKSLEDTAAQLRELVSQFRYEDAKQMAFIAHAGR